MRRTVSRLLLVFAGFAGMASATSFVAVSDEALADHAPLVLVGEVVAVDRAAGLADGVVRTEFEIAVEDVLKGEAAGRIRVAVPGGEAGGSLALQIYGAPLLREGERVLLFLSPRGKFYRIEHLMLGVFHELRVGDRRFAMRRLEGASEMRIAGSALQPVVSRQPLRDFDAFAEWVRARSFGGNAPEYRVAEEPGLRSAVDAFTLFVDDGTGQNLRWFAFDTAGSVSWRAFSTGQTGISGGGYSEFQTALAAWNAELQTPINYQYNASTTSSTNGLSTFDSLNTIVFNDASNELPSFSCTSGGVLAFGGPWYDGGVSRVFQGQTYHEIVNADIVVNSGLSCFFSASPNSSKAAQELFGHELGHTLGIGHSCGDSDSPACSTTARDQALMRSFVHDDGRGAQLNSDDQAAAQSLYKQTGTLPTAPTNLAASAFSTTQINLTWTDNASNETEFRIEVKVLGGSYVDLGSVAANSTAASVVNLTAETGYAFRVRARNATGNSGYSNEVIAATNAVVGTCVANGQTVCLSAGRFRVRALWKPTAGVQALANVAPAGSASSGIFYFNDPSNWELLIKVLNACGLNSRYWVFYAATTDVELVTTVADTLSGKVKVYFNPLGTPAAPVQDTSAFATCP